LGRSKPLVLVREWSNEWANQPRYARECDAQLRQL